MRYSLRTMQCAVAAAALVCVNVRWWQSTVTVSLLYSEAPTEYPSRYMLGLPLLVLCIEVALVGVFLAGYYIHKYVARNG